MTEPLFGEFHDDDQDVDQSLLIETANNDIQLWYFMLALHSGDDELFASLLDKVLDDVETLPTFIALLVSRLYLFVRADAFAGGVSFSEYVGQSLAAAAQSAFSPEDFDDES
jgi:hypothetical protein